MQVQEYAYAAQLDGAVHPELAKLAAAGTYGQNPGNIARDITRDFLHESKIPMTHMVEVSARDPKTSKPDDVLAGVFLPHLMFHSLQAYDIFDEVFGIEDIESFWQGVHRVADPRLGHYHFERQNPDWDKKYIPCFVHGDAAPFQQRDSLMAWVWGSLLSTMSSVDCSLMASCFPKLCTMDDDDDEETWSAIWMWLQWSFQACFEGLHPMQDPFGNDFPKGSVFAKLKGTPLNDRGFKVCVWILQGDHEHFSNTLGLPHWSTAAPCWDCNTETRHQALTWKKLKLQPGGWVPKTMAQAILDRPSHPVFRVEGVTEKTCGHDVLHVLYCKGVLSHLLGSTLHTMLWPRRGRQTVAPAARLATIFDRVCQLYSERKTPTRLTNLHIKMFTDEAKPWVTHPFLKVKGSECRHLLPIITIISGEIGTGSEHDNKRTLALTAITRFCQHLDDCDTFLTDGQATLALQLCEEFFEHYIWLQEWATREGRETYHSTIKFHMLHHIALCARFLNPKVLWCFKAEDNIGKLAIMAHSVSFGVKSTHLSTKLCAKYREFLHFRLTRGEQDW